MTPDEMRRARSGGGDGTERALLYRCSESVDGSKTIPRRDPDRGEGMKPYRARPRNGPTVESVAAIYCRDLAKAADRAAYTLRDVGTKEARQHAKEARGAAKMARAWERELMKIHISKQRRKP